MNFQNIIDHDGLSLALTGLAIVFAALTLISVFIAVLPRILAAIEPWLPESEHDPAPATLVGRGAADAPHPGQAPPEVVAAIAVALRARGN